MEWKRLSPKHKNNKILYYLKGAYRDILPEFFHKQYLKGVLSRIATYDADYLEDRVNYYCRLNAGKLIGGEPLSSFSKPKKQTAYHYDFKEISRLFDPELKVLTEYGDVIHVPDHSTLVKSRPISNNNQNSVLLKWDKMRHFLFVKDNRPYQDKLDQLVWRGKVFKTRPNRQAFLEQYADHPLCNVGGVNHDAHNPALRPRMTIDEQLKYKFILSLEGKDVATNLKWIMSSNSVAVMPEPKYETWFMEGRLLPDYHYIKIADDFSDLKNRLNHFLKRPQEVRQIISNANQYVDQFRDKNREEVLQYLVMKRYFEKTGQL